MKKLGILKRSICCDEVVRDVDILWFEPISESDDEIELPWEIDIECKHTYSADFRNWMEQVTNKLNKLSKGE